MALWNNTDTEESKPKYLNAADKAATVGVDVAEAQNAANIAKGINTPGWVKYTTYTDGNGSTRNKAEVLVAMSTITGDNDTLDPAPVITIATQPVAASVTSPATATFTVATTVTNGGTVTYQWQVSADDVTYTNITGATSDTLEVASGDDEYVTGNYFKVVTSVVGGVSVTSNSVQITIV
jgi:hypothetical protein